MFRIKLQTQVVTILRRRLFNFTTTKNVCTKYDAIQVLLAKKKINSANAADRHKQEANAVT